VAGALVILLALLVVALMIGTGHRAARVYRAAPVTFLRAIGVALRSLVVDRASVPTKSPDDDEEETRRRECARRVRREVFAARLRVEEEYEEEEYEEEEKSPRRRSTRSTAEMESDWELPSPSLLVRTKDVKQDRSAIEDMPAGNSSKPSRPTASRPRWWASPSDRP
jgi:hypothetical protein